MDTIDTDINSKNNDQNNDQNKSRKRRSLKEWIDYILPGYGRLPLILVLVINCSVYWGARQIAGDRPHLVLGFEFENAIPFLSWSIIIYLGCYVFWVVNYILGCRFDRKMMRTVVLTDIIAKLVCFVFYVALPTTMVRPEVTGTGFWDAAMRWLYSMDAADNLFPSIHCLVSWVSWQAVRTNKKIPSWYRWFSLAMALAVCVSTLTTKQHSIIDVFAGIALAELCRPVAAFLARKIGDHETILHGLRARRLGVRKLMASRPVVRKLLAHKRKRGMKHVFNGGGH